MSPDQSTFRIVLALVCSLSLALSFLMTILVRRYAIRAGVLDRPNSRSSHVIPTPRGGGIAILGASTIALAVAGALGLVQPRDALAFDSGAWLLGILGWIDDHRSLRASTRLMVQTVVAVSTLVVVGGLPFVRIGTWTAHLGWFGYVLGTIGLVWSINLFNFMDGIDALATSQAVLILGAVAMLLIRTGDASLAVIALLIAMASLGFLPWNWPRARIFLGDVGSAPLGYLIGAIAVASENRREIPLIVIALIGGVFVVDATVTLLRRLAKREPLSQAHRSHAYQRLAHAFGSHGVVSFGAAAETVLFALIGAAVVRVPSLLVPGVLLAGAVLLASLMYAARRAPAVPESSAEPLAAQKVLSSEHQTVIDR